MAEKLSTDALAGIVAAIVGRSPHTPPADAAKMAYDYAEALPVEAERREKEKADKEKSKPAEGKHGVHGRS